jgi:diaminopimelate epimerase
MKARRIRLSTSERAKMAITFTKMHGLGNDFMVVRWPDDLALPSAQTVAAWGNRRTGVGFDQLLLLESPTDAMTRARLKVINSDGSEAEQCGNGIRCVARFLAESAEEEFVIASDAGAIAVQVRSDGLVRANLGEPRFDPAAVPYLTNARAARYRLNLTGGEVEFGVVSMGNPHAVIAVDSVDSARVGIIGSELAAHPAFADSVNVGFAEQLSPTRIRLRVFERGIGETLACGTGAAAAVAIGRRRGALQANVAVQLPGGELSVEWQGEGADLWQTGATTKVYEGLIEI